MTFSGSDSSDDLRMYLSEHDDVSQNILEIIDVGRPWCPRSRQQYEDDIKTWEQRLAYYGGIEKEQLKYAMYHFCPKYIKRLIICMNMLAMPYHQFKSKLGELWPFLDNGKSASEHKSIRSDVRIYAHEFEEEMCNLGEFTNEWLRRHGIFQDERVQIFFRNLPYAIRKRLMEESDLLLFTWQELRARVLWHYRSIYERPDQWSTESLCTLSNDLSEEGGDAQWDERLPSPKCSHKFSQPSICVECYGAGHEDNFCPIKTLTSFRCGNCGGAHATIKCRASIVPLLNTTPGFAIHVTASGYKIKFIGHGSVAKSARQLAYALLAEADKLY